LTQEAVKEISIKPLKWYPYNLDWRLSQIKFNKNPGMDNVLISGKYFLSADGAGVFFTGEIKKALV
jgi:hypothetical protein